MLKNMIFEQIGGDFGFRKPNEELSQVVKILPRIDGKKKVLAIRKIYTTIREIADDANESMGYPLLLLLMCLIINITRFGYRFVIAISSSTETHDIAGKTPSKFIKIFK